MLKERTLISNYRRAALAKKAADITVGGSVVFPPQENAKLFGRCTAKAVKQLRKLLGFRLIFDDRQIMGDCFTQQLEILVGKNGAGAGWL
jgi:hypothetical protein